MTRITDTASIARAAELAPVRDAIRTAKLRLLRMHFESGVGHIGGNLSCLDFLVCFYRQRRPDDLFVLSKGHSAGALYIALWSIGALSDEIGRAHV